MRTSARRSVGLSCALAVGVALLAPAGVADARSQPEARGLTSAGEPGPPPLTSRHDPRHPTSAAKRAGVKRGNAPMGWRHRSSATSDTGAERSAAESSGLAVTGVLGIDVSSYQKRVNWAAYRASGRVFAYVKATEGTSYRNPYFSSQYTGSHNAGFIRGAYHFANPAGKSGAAQADYFVKYGGAWSADGRTLPGVLDIEYNPYGKTCYGVSKSKMRSWISSFVTRYKQRTGRDAVIYTTAGWWQRCTGNTTRFSRTNPLWVARWGSSSPGTLPGGWPYYTFWQYSSTRIDQDKFSASYSRLKVLARGR